MQNSALDPISAMVMLIDSVDQPGWLFTTTNRVAVELGSGTLSQATPSLRRG